MKNLFTLVCLMLSIPLLGQLGLDECYIVDGWGLGGDIIINSDNEFVLTGGSDAGAYFIRVDLDGIVKAENTIEVALTTGRIIKEIELDGQTDLHYLIYGVNPISDQVPGIYTAFITLVDNEGNEVWYKTLENQGELADFSMIDHIAVYNDEQQVLISDRYALYRIKYDGTPWDKFLYTDLVGTAYSVFGITHDEGGIYVLGESDGDKSILKLNKDGMLLDQIPFTNEFDKYSDFEKTTDDNFLIIGRKNYFISAAQVRPEGEVAWDRTYELEDLGTGSAVKVLDTENGYLIIGNANNPESDQALPVALKIDAEGQGEWTKILRNKEEDEILGGALLLEGEIVLAGSSYCLASSDFPQIFVSTADTLSVIPIVTSLSEINTSTGLVKVGNPFCDNIQIQGEEHYAYQLFDMQARLVMTGSTNVAQHGLASLPNGVYFLRLISEEGNLISKKIVKVCR